MEHTSRPLTTDRGDLALVLTGGGARAAYQVGFLRHLARHFPDIGIPIITGVSAGAVNAAHLAQHRGTFSEAVDELSGLWTNLMPESVFRVDATSLTARAVLSGMSLLSGGALGSPRVRGMVNTEPLREFLTGALDQVDGRLAGVDYNLDRGKLKAVALNATSYSTGQSVVWVQGRDIETWTRPKRRSEHTTLTVDHVMASTALPLFFPSVKVGDEWYGDGGIRLSAPLSPALHLGAHKILVISTRFSRTQTEADRPTIIGYPPPAQILGVLYNAIFLDLVDQDVRRMEKINALVSKLPPDQREGMRVVDLLVLRPSADLGKIAGNYEPRLPRTFRYLTRGLGTRQTSSPDLLSMIMFQADYMRRLIELGEADAEARAEDIHAFLNGAVE